MQTFPSGQLKRLLFVLNPISGDINKSQLRATITAYCAERGRRAEFFDTTGDQDIIRLRTLLATDSPLDAVFAAGGDGTVSLVAEALAGSTVPLGILPLGSGNGMAKDLAIPLTLNEALGLIWQHDIRQLDTLRVGGRFTVHLADMGFNACVVQRFAEGGVRGPGAYVRIATREYAGYQPATYQIETDNGTWQGKAFMLTIANANTFGSNVVINPGRALDDGEFEICLIAPFPGIAVPGLLYRLYTSNFDDSDYTQRLSCHRARITVAGARQVLVQLDGEPYMLPCPVEISLQPCSLRVLVPPATAGARLPRP
ncbi:diacylglycerol/lipid kinase family protein [Hymenobacter psychrophilus]|uniref:Diacylglycerol kinase family enzyme n=1 Tax=Hymenobacter psychrophilus TaxID=651662 RepID=A0A1H3CNH8_9BACT|nr:diacylglycerol kinase family protein [Hymenobacter psychrophilus]SDX55438.1 Diacylglycerol kinase family enzyme [Hymenobacter psychrophilus]